MGEFRTVDDFLNYRGSDGGGARKLSAKKLKEQGHLNAWLFCGMLPTAVWYHGIPEFVVRRDRNDDSKVLKNVWPRQFACWEDEAILKKQRFRTPEGEREHPPRVCPDCILIEVVRRMIRLGEISDVDVLFEFAGADKPAEDRIIHAGGFAGTWKRDGMSAEEAARLAQHGIYMGNSGAKMGAWSESAIAKLNYVFAIVDNDDVAGGLQVCIQTQSLGDKVKKEINKQIRSDGDPGNPFLHPYCLQFSYNAAEKKFDDKYDASRCNRFPLTPQIEALIRGERPDISRYVRRADLDTHRAMLERHCRLSHKIDWDAVFGPAKKLAGAAPGSTAQVPASVATPTPTPTSRKLVESASSPATEKWGDPCDECRAPMLVGALVCGKCGAKYEEQQQTAAPVAAPPIDFGTPGLAEPGGVYEDDLPF